MVLGGSKNFRPGDEVRSVLQGVGEIVFRPD
jgi:hypothetical protein